MPSSAWPVVETISSRLVGAVPQLFLLHGHVERCAVAGDEEPGGRDGLRIVRGDFVTRDLPAHERIIGEVVVERPDHEIAEVVCVGPVGVGFLPVAVSVAGDVDPMPRPPLAVLRRGQQLVDQSLVNSQIERG